MAQTRRNCTTVNNEEKNTYTKTQITNATIKLLKQYPFSNISISQITSIANVSRNSFYRNYVSKEDILLQHIHQLISNWDTEYKKQDKDSNTELFGSFFEHLSDNREFYLLLKNQDLFHLVLKELLKHLGPKSEYDNMTAYTTSFITYGMYGWIEEWIGRGMKESADTMSALLSSNGMK